jgi:hypothetical protein
MSIQAVGRAAASAYRGFKAAAPAIVVAGAIAAAVAVWRAREGAKPPDPFLILGRSYVSSLGEVYAGAWLEGASALDSGKPVADALGVVASSWQAGRVALFDKTATPAFARIVAENKADVSPQDKAALAAAWRSFAAGLKSPASGK